MSPGAPSHLHQACVQMLFLNKLQNFDCELLSFFFFLLTGIKSFTIWMENGTPSELRVLLQLKRLCKSALKVATELIKFSGRSHL